MEKSSHSNWWEYNKLQCKPATALLPALREPALCHPDRSGGTSLVLLSFLARRPHHRNLRRHLRNPAPSQIHLGPEVQPMVDRIDAETRSKVMSRITKKWSRIDKTAHNILKSAKIRHSMYPTMTGSPDILVYPDFLVFLDGCFWHCCPKCFRMPKSRLRYWRPKLVGNRQRDVKLSRLLRNQGWKVVRIWEHEIRTQPNVILQRLEELHHNKQGSRTALSLPCPAIVPKPIPRRLR